MDELIERFSLENINRSPGRFDSEKCAWINQQHLLKLDPAAFAEAARPFVENAGLPINDRYPAAAASVREKVRLLTEVPEALDFLLKDEIEIDGQALEKVRKNEAAGTLLAALSDAFDALDPWSADAAKECIGATAVAKGAKPGQLMFPTRVALSGKTGGPDLGDILGILGKDRCLSRLRDFVERRL